MKQTAVLLLIFIPVFAFAGWRSVTQTSSYADCILENMNSVVSDLAAVTVKEACFNKHNKIIELENLADISGSLSPTSESYYNPVGSRNMHKVTIKNGTAHRISKVQLKVWNNELTRVIALDNPFLPKRDIYYLHVLPFSQNNYYIDLTDFKGDMEFSFHKVWGVVESR